MDFIANILAKLDTSQAESQLKTLTKDQTVNLKVQLTGDTDVTKILSKLDSSFASAGQDAGKSYSKGVQAGLKSYKFNGDTFYKQYLDKAKKDIDEAKTVQTNFSKLLSGLDTKGIDKNALNAARAYNKEISALQKQQEKQLKSYTDTFNNGKYSADSKTMSANLEKYSGQNTDSLEKARNYLKEYQDTYKEIQNHFDTTSAINFKDDELVQKFDKLETAASKYKNVMREVSTESTKTLSANAGIVKSNEILTYYNNNTKALKKYGAELRQLAEDAKNATTQVKLNEINDSFKKLKSTISAEGLTGKSPFDEVKRAFFQIAEFTGMYGILQNVIQDIPRAMLQAVKDIDKAQVELIKVSNASNTQLNQYWDEATESAKKYGATISDVISSTADWSRLGYGLDDAKKLSDATTLLQKVGDNMTQESSSQGLISTLRGFNMQADEVGKIVDVANQIANTQPIDTSGIFEGLERSASSMSAANNTLEQTVALLTAANSVVQDPASIGTAFKTISMRIRGADTELQEAGLDTEGMAESVAKLRKEIISLSGVDIMRDENTFKSTYDILDELSTKWSDLTDIQQASITELIAGKRQGNIVSALMSNFDIARKSLNTALNDSAGSAEQELENWNKGIEASISRLQAQFQELSTDTINSNFLKNIADTGTNVLEVLDWVIDKFGILQTLIGGFAIGKGITSFVKSFDKPACIAS